CRRATIGVVVMLRCRVLSSFFVLSLLSVVVCFFFFQAEDGIRDWSVTGVQTCALPIWTRLARRRRCVLLLVDLLVAVGVRAEARSEERRVGKECRSRGAPDH